MLVIIGILATATALSIRGMLARGKRSAVKGELATIAAAVEQYEADTGNLPSAGQGLTVLTQATAKSAGHPYLTQAPIDPWGRPYQYNAPGRPAPGQSVTPAFEVFSLGPDGQEGGDDIGTWDLVRQLNTTPQ